VRVAATGQEAPPAPGREKIGGCPAALRAADALADRGGHLQINPSTILFPEKELQGEPKLTDQGLWAVLKPHIAEVFRERGPARPRCWYLSPEQIRSGDVGTASDVWSLGLVSAECLLGQPLLPASSLEEAREAASEVSLLERLRQAEARLGKYAPSIRRALAFAPNSRLPTASEFAREFRAA
jgi:serine/threonine protein kinase